MHMCRAYAYVASNGSLLCVYGSASVVLSTPRSKYDRSASCIINSGWKSYRHFWYIDGISLCIHLWHRILKTKTIRASERTRRTPQTPSAFDFISGASLLPLSWPVFVFVFLFLCELRENLRSGSASTCFRLMIHDMKRVLYGLYRVMLAAGFYANIRRTLLCSIIVICI